MTVPTAITFGPGFLTPSPPKWCLTPFSAYARGTGWSGKEGGGAVTVETSSEQGLSRPL